MRFLFGILGLIELKGSDIETSCIDKFSMWVLQKVKGKFEERAYAIIVLDICDVVRPDAE